MIHVGCIVPYIQAKLNARRDILVFDYCTFEHSRNILFKPPCIFQTEENYTWDTAILASLNAHLPPAHSTYALTVLDVHENENVHTYVIDDLTLVAGNQAPQAVARVSGPFVNGLYCPQTRVEFA